MTGHAVRIVCAFAAVCTVSVMPVMSAQGAVQVALQDAVRAPITVPLALGQPALMRLPALGVELLLVTPPGIVHAIERDNEILLVPLREGTAELEIGLGTDTVARFELAVGSGWSGVRSVVVTEGASVAVAPPVHATASHVGSQQAVAPRPQPAPQAPGGQDQPQPSSPRAQAPRQPPAQQGVTQAETPDAFIRTLTAQQRAALTDYLASPSIQSLAVLVRTLDDTQRMTLVRLLASQSQPPRVPAPPGPSQPSPGAAAQQPQQQPPSSGQPSSPSAATWPQTRQTAVVQSQSVDPPVHVAAPDGVPVHVVPTRAFGLVYLSYVVQNQTSRALRADPRDMEAVGVSGPVTVRQIDIGTPGVITPGAMETGVIAIAPTGDSAAVLWRLRTDDGTVLPVEMTVSR